MNHLIPEKNNGYAVKHHASVASHLSVTLCEDKNKKLVVWYFNHEAGGFSNGYYTTNFDQAKKVFIQRIDRWI